MNPSFKSLRVLDLSRYLPGGYATQVLADLGAEVIKVEDTGMGDFCRHEEPVKDGMSYYFAALSRNKKSISLNLKDPEALAAFRKLAATSDVIVESFRPGVTRKLGIDYDTLRTENPGLIYCSFSGYGQNDPRSLKPLHDINMLAQSGFLSLNEGRKSPLHLCDLASAMVAAQSILAALFDRTTSNEGHYIDISMFDSFVWWNSLLDSRWSYRGGDLTAESLLYPADSCFYNIFDTKDGGKLAVGLIEDKFWRSFCEDVGHPELIERPADGYATMVDIVASKTTDEWETWLAERDLCLAIVVDKSRAIEQLLDLEPEMMSYVNFPHLGKILQTNLPHAISGMKPDLAEAKEPPTLGRDTREVLSYVGVSAADVDAMEQRGAVRA